MNKSKIKRKNAKCKYYRKREVCNNDYFIRNKKKDKKLFKELKKKLDVVYLVSQIDSLEIKVDYLLEKDLGISTQIRESSLQLQKEDEKSEYENLMRERGRSPNRLSSQLEEFKQDFNNGI